MTPTQRVKKYGQPTTKAVVLKCRVRLYEVPPQSDYPAYTLKVVVHDDVYERFNVAFLDACRCAHWFPTEVQGYNVRAIRGGTQWSLHSWALAWDCFGRSGPIDPITGRHRPPDEWFRVWEAHGFTWGGRWKKSDPHHVEWSR
jgi:hypothetical protein